MFHGLSHVPQCWRRFAAHATRTRLRLSFAAGAAAFFQFFLTERSYLLRYIQGLPIDGITLRSPEKRDAEAMIALLKQVFGETPYLLRTPEEFGLSVEDERKWLRAREDDPRGAFIVAWDGDRPVGTVSVMEVSPLSRLRHHGRGWGYAC